MKRMFTRCFSKVFVAALVAGSVVITTGGIAQASEAPFSEPHTSEIAQGPSSPQVAVLGSKEIVTGSGDFASSITLPGNAVLPKELDTAAVPDELFVGQGEPIASTVLPDASLTSYKTETGTQTLISINSASAASEYRFPLALSDDSSVNIEPDGAASVRDKTGEVLGKYLSPWAIDANGEKVATSFSIQGNTLVQTVEFGATTAFPVIADPQWWQMAASAAAGAAVGAAVVALIPGVGPTIGAIVGGCVVGAMNAMFDGANFWGGFWGCATGAAIGGVAGMVRSIVKNILAARGFGV